MVMGQMRKHHGLGRQEVTKVLTLARVHLKRPLSTLCPNATHLKHYGHYILCFPN